MAATYQQIQAWLQAQLTKLGTAVKNWANGKFATKTELGDYLKSDEAEETYQPIGEYPTKTEMSSAIEEAKEAIVGEDLKDSLATLESIKSWKEQHGTDYTNLVSTVQGKLDKATYDEDKATFLTKTEAGNTYQTKEGMSEYAKASALEGYQPKGDYALESALDNYQPKGDYALSSALENYQPKGDYVEEDDLEGYIKFEDLVDIDESVFTAMFAEA